MKSISYTKSLFTAIVGLLSVGVIHSQLVINELQISNMTTVPDEFGDYDDWFEIYNAGNQPVNLAGYTASDRPNNPGKWALPDWTLGPGEYKLIYATGRDLVGEESPFHHFEVPVFPWNTWRYLVPDTEPPANWRELDFDDSNWNEGTGGFGFGNNDDGTVIPYPAYSVFSRTKFTLNDPNAAIFMLLAAEYEDAFVCYLNGTEIARANIGTPGVPPAFDELANGQHQAQGYQGLDWDAFEIPVSLLTEGENVLALQVHNYNYWSQSLTGNVILIFASTNPLVQTELAPEWLGVSVDQTHANFGLSSGETLVLANAQGEIIDEIEIPMMQTDHVLRRSTDGSPEWCVSTVATPGFANAGPCYPGYEAQPTFSIESGVYTSTLYVELTHPNPNATIRYTWDGSFPTESSQLYTGPFAVGGSSVISARAFSSDYLPSHVKKNTYLINETDLGLPIVSISTDPDNLWHPETGIHVMGPNGLTSGYPYFNANFWQNWEREAYVEYFDENHQKQMEGPVGLKIHGGWSRAREQKSFRIQSKAKYGMERMDYPMIPDKPHIKSYKGINLRNGGNDYDNYRFHDALMERAMRTTEADYMAYSPAIVFVNGEYWGFMEIRENMDQHYVTDNHNIPSKDVTLISHNYMGFNVISGNPESFFELHQYATQTPVNSPEFFPGLSDRLDIENYADYIIAETYWGNGDWNNGGNNTKFFHDDRPGGKWRYMLFDLDFGMGLASGVNDNYLPNAASWTQSGQIFAAAIQNNQFRNYFINRYADLINTVFQSDRVNEMAYEMRDEILPIWERHRDRWNTNWDGPYGVLDWRLNWAQQRVQSARNIVQNHYGLPNQVNVTLDVLPAGAGTIHISTIRPGEEEYPWTGVYFNGVPVKITAIENPGYTFSHWNPNSLMPSGSESREIEFTIPNSTAFTAVFVGQPVAEPLSVTELMFNPDSQNPSGDWIEIRNNMDVPMNMTGWTLKDDNHFNEYKFANGSFLQPGEYYIIAQNPEAFQAAYPEADNVLGPLGFGFGNKADEVNIYRPDGSPYIQFAYTDTDSPQLRCSDGCGHSRGHSGGSDYAWENWFLECEGGSPGSPFTPCEYDVLVSEINYNAHPNFNSADWLELFNPGSASLSLGGWTLRDRNDNQFHFPPGSMIGAGERLVLAEHMAMFALEYPWVQNVMGPLGFSLSNSSDMLKLYDTQGKLHYAMRYFSSQPWPWEPAGQGKTLEFISGSDHQCHPEAWFAGCFGGSPGLPFDPLCPQYVMVEEIQTTAGTSVTVWPNPTSDALNIKAQNTDIALIRIFDLQGREVLPPHRINGPMAVLSLSSLTSGIYLAIVTDTSGGHSAVKVVKE